MNSNARPHRVWPVVAFGIGLMLAGFLTAIALQNVNLHSARAADARRVTAQGTVAAAGLGNDHKGLRVRWQDRFGRSHTARFTLYDRDDSWTEGDAFDVKYDPRDVNGGVVAAPDYADYVEEGGGHSSDELGGLWFYTALACCFTLAWLLRGLLTWRAASAPVTTAYAEPCYYFYKHTISCAAVRLTFPESSRTGKRTWFQRVMWTPAFDEIPSNRPVTVRMRGRLTRRAVIDLPDGNRLWPAGRLRRRFLIDLGHWRRPDPSPPPTVGSRRPMPTLRTWAVLLLFPALFELRIPSSGLELLIATAAFYGFMAHLWAWSGGVAAGLWRRVAEEGPEIPRDHFESGWPSEKA